MGVAKVLGIIFLILIIIAGVIGFDLYQTNQVIQETDFSSVISDPTYSVSDDNSTVTISVTVDLPDAGYIPKGINLDITVDFDGKKQTASESISFGESKQISLDFVLTQQDRDTLSSGGSLTVIGTADVTPTYFGFAITQLTQQVDLGSQTISV